MEPKMRYQTKQNQDLNNKNSFNQIHSFLMTFLIKILTTKIILSQIHSFIVDRLTKRTSHLLAIILTMISLMLN